MANDQLISSSRSYSSYWFYGEYKWGINQSMTESSTTILSIHNSIHLLVHLSIYLSTFAHRFSFFFFAPLFIYETIRHLIILIVWWYGLVGYNSFSMNIWIQTKHLIEWLKLDEEMTKDRKEKRLRIERSDSAYWGAISTSSYLISIFQVLLWWIFLWPSPSFVIIHEFILSTFCFKPFFSHHSTSSTC